MKLVTNREFFSMCGSYKLNFWHGGRRPPHLCVIAVFCEKSKFPLIPPSLSATQHLCSFSFSVDPLTPLVKCNILWNILVFKAQPVSMQPNNTVKHFLKAFIYFIYLALAIVYKASTRMYYSKSGSSPSMYGPSQQKLVFWKSHKRNFPNFFMYSYCLYEHPS